MVTKKLQTNILHQHRNQISQQNNNNQVWQYINKNKTHNYVRFIIEIKRQVQY